MKSEHGSKCSFLTRVSEHRSDPTRRAGHRRQLHFGLLGACRSENESRDWVAELECGHQQRVRHNPPWTHSIYANHASNFFIICIYKNHRGISLPESHSQFPPNFQNLPRFNVQMRFLHPEWIYGTELVFSIACALFFAPGFEWSSFSTTYALFAS